ncbi:MAG: hypothetical protein DMG13_18685 [Acidobacteria bacterium]|nr:MAG: hypothetical protein DMG13_18685 [Acidobacteriota bacterium]
MLSLLATPLFADTQDTAVFRTRMLPDNEIPPIAAPGNSASGTITVHVTRDEAGNVNAATVTFDIDYTSISALTFTGLHIHNAPAGQGGAQPVIDSGISGTNPVNVTAGLGTITRIVDYASTDTNALKFVTGLLATPENYYVNIHTTLNPGGFMRGQLLATRLVLRPVMSAGLETPPINLDAEGAARVEIQVNRDLLTGAITSGVVTFDVDYRFPGPVTITGLHIHNAAAGVNGPIVIDSGINETVRAITGALRGNIFRVVEIDNTNTSGLAALTGLMNDPSQYYINLYTGVNLGGAIRGQFSRNVFVFFNLMTQAEENPPTNVPGWSNSMTYVRVDRDSTGNVVSGAVSFNLNFNMGGGPVTFTGLHIHREKIGVNGSVVIDTRIGGGAASVTDADGIGSINREVPIDSSNPSALESLRGLIENPENYYVNIHTTQFPGGIIRSQLAKETYHFKTAMTTANEVPPITTANTTATGWVTAQISRDANRTINGGTVTFDVSFTNDFPITFTGLHIHPGAAGVNGPAVINTGLSATSPVESASGSGNITRVVTIDPTNAAALAVLATLITSPDNAYVNIHSTQFPGGVSRSQMFPVVNTGAQAVGGGEWISSITIRNPSNAAAVQGVLDLFESSGALMPEAISDPNISFVIQPSGSVTFSTHNKGPLKAGFARIFSNGNVNVETRYIHPSFRPVTNGAVTATSRAVSLPVAFGSTANQNTGISIVANSAGTLTLSLNHPNGVAVVGASKTIEVTAGQQITAFVTELFPVVDPPQFAGSMNISISPGTISVLGLQFDTGVTPVTVSSQP